jgi:uncharacterized integral membrane protein (TIGR00697 family)
MRFSNMTPIALDEKNLKKIVIALALYLVSLFASNTLGLKIMPLPFGLHLSVAFFCFPVVFIMTDVIGEVYGKRVAKLFVLAGFISTILFVLYSVISLALPWDAAGMWVHDAYDTVFAVSIRVAIASVAAFGIAEYQDVLSFFFFKTNIGARYFWVRSNLSNLWSQLLDSTIFMVIAFYGVYSNHTLIEIIISWWLFKVLMGFIYTPLSYLGIRLLRDKPIA